MRRLFTLLFLCCIITGSAQTNLTLILNRNNHKIDSVKISRFSDDKALVIPYKDTITVSFDERYADLFSVGYYENGKSSFTWQRWLDTGSIKVISRVALSLTVDTIINSPLTYTVQKFYSQLGDYRHHPDSAFVNNLLVNTYKENLGNPFSFVTGRIYYDYNQQNKQRILEMNALEREQDKEIKKSIFYAMMLRERFRNSEKLFINYFAGNVLLKSSGQITNHPFDLARYNILFFAGSATTQAIAEFNALNSKWAEFDPKDFTFFIVYASKDKDIWKPLLEKSRISSFQLVSEQNFMSETLFYPDTKFYIVDGRARVPGFYDSFTEISDHFKNR